MGEVSKSSGEIGEKLAKKLTQLIGWKDAVENISIPCEQKKHKNISGKSKTTHGTDRVFIYNSPFHDDVTTVVHISVKNSIKDIPSVATLRSKFKEYYLELQETIECSILNAEIAEQIAAKKPRKTISHVGLLIWHFKDDLGRDVRQDLSPIELPSSMKYPVYLFDNRRQEFLYSAMTSMEPLRSDGSVEFYYPDLGAKLGAEDSRLGSILPLELAVSDIVPVVRISNKIYTLYIYADQKFSLGAYRRLINYAQLMTRGLVSEIRIGMTDYDISMHGVEAIKAKNSFELNGVEVFPFSIAAKVTNLLED